MKFLLTAAAVAGSLLFTPVRAENLLTGDTGAEVGIRFLTLGGFSGELVPASRDTKEFFEG